MSEYEDWLDEKLGKNVLWTATARGKLLTRDLTGEGVKECLLSGERRETVDTESGPKIVIEKALHDPIYEAMVVVYVDCEDYYLIISNHLRKRKQKRK
jgi:hypothetical protein